MEHDHIRGGLDHVSPEYHRAPDDRAVAVPLVGDALAAGRFLGVALAEMSAAGVSLPLLISDSAAVEKQGPLGPIWRTLWDRLEILNRSQTWLAAEVGISPSYLSCLIRDWRAPSGRIRRRM